MVPARKWQTAGWIYRQIREPPHFAYDQPTSFADIAHALRVDIVDLRFTDRRLRSLAARRLFRIHKRRSALSALQYSRRLRWRDRARQISRFRARRAAGHTWRHSRKYSVCAWPRIWVATIQRLLLRRRRNFLRRTHCRERMAPACCRAFKRRASKCTYANALFATSNND